MITNINVIKLNVTFRRSNINRVKYRKPKSKARNQKGRSNNA